jgi:hypothetical protein
MHYINHGVSFIGIALHIVRSHLPVIAVGETTVVYIGVYKVGEGILST